jgi:hypothetical protein
MPANANSGRYSLSANHTSSLSWSRGSAPAHTPRSCWLGLSNGLPVLSPPVLRRRVADLRDRISTGSRRRRHPPSHRQDLALAGRVAHDRSRPGNDRNVILSTELLSKGGSHMSKIPVKLLIAALLLAPMGAIAQSGGGGGGSAGGSAGSGSAGGGAAGAASAGASSGPTAGTGSAVGSPNAGSAGAGTAAVSGVPSGPANAGGLNNSGNDLSGAGNSAKVPTAPGTNSLGTANSSGSAGNASAGSGGSSTTTGRTAVNGKACARRASGRHIPARVSTAYRPDETRRS